MNKLMLLFCLIVFCSCEKNIDFKLNESSSTLVVDAEIENNKVPTVILTKSVPFFSKIDPQILATSFVHGADVYLSNGTLTHKLKEYAFPLAPGYTGYLYSIDSSNLSTAFLGALQTNYTLKIVSEGKEYYSSVSIPGYTTIPDTVFFKPAPLNPDTNKRVMFIRATDPPGLGTYIRYFTKKNSEPFFPPVNSVYNDQVIDGTTYEVQLPPGIDRNDPPKPDSNFFRKGDTVTLKYCNIDRSTYTFWNTWEFAYQSIGNPFSQPGKVISNISNGALGVFSGYAAWYRTIIVQ